MIPFGGVCGSGWMLSYGVFSRLLQTHAKKKNLRFHFHVYKLAFGFSPHGKPVAAAAEATQQLQNLSTYSSLVFPTHGC